MLVEDEHVALLVLEKVVHVALRGLQQQLVGGLAERLHEALQALLAVPAADRQLVGERAGQGEDG